MSCWNKEDLENMLEDVINELQLSEQAIEDHGQTGTPPAELVRLVLQEKDKKIKMLESGMVNAAQTSALESAKKRVEELGADLTAANNRIAELQSQLHRLENPPNNIDY